MESHHRLSPAQKSETRKGIVPIQIGDPSFLGSSWLDDFLFARIFADIGHSIAARVKWRLESSFNALATGPGIMSEIILNDEQAKIIISAHDDVLVRDPHGNVIARMARIPSEDEGEESGLIAEARRRLASDQPRHTTQEVLKRLESLEQ